MTYHHHFTTLGLVLLVLCGFITPAAHAAVVTTTVNCPGVNGGGNLNCTSPMQCCGAMSTMDPQCYNPHKTQCCVFYLDAAPCGLNEACCGEMGPGASSNAFCCGADATCCQTTSDGMSQCCRKDQICCGGYNTLCCDKATETCGGSQENRICVPKNPITPAPHPAPGQMLWRIQIGNQTTSLVSPFNNTHVVVSAAGPYLVERLTGKKTSIGFTRSLKGTPSLTPHLFMVLSLLAAKRRLSTKTTPLLV